MQKQFTLERTYDAYITIEIVERNKRYYAVVDRNLDDLWQEDDEYECWIDESNNLMTEENIYNSTEEEYDAIIQTFRSYIEANGVKYARMCDKCGNGMNEGYIVNGGDEYYCSAECLHKDYSPKEWQEMYDESEENGGNDHYWTEWEDECAYVLFNNQLINVE